jgi:hypothetical protein
MSCLNCENSVLVFGVLYLQCTISAASLLPVLSLALVLRAVAILMNRLGLVDSTSRLHNILQLLAQVLAL